MHISSKMSNLTMICLFLVFVRSRADMHLSVLSAKMLIACVQIFFIEHVIAGILFQCRFQFLHNV